MTEPEISDLRRTALHEAGHAVAEVVLGRKVDYVSIRPGKTFRGIEVSARHEVPAVDQFQYPGIVPQQPAALRADVEARVIVYLTGDIAALYLGPRTTSYRDWPADEDLARRALESLGPRLAELVAAHEESDEPSDGDEANAWRLAEAFVGAGAGAHYVEWLRVSARDLVLRYSAAILRVADALERRHVLRGEQVAALVHPPRDTPAERKPTDAA